MIELDEIQEPRKSNYTPIVILGVVALLLVVVGFIGYKDYIDSKAEKIVSESKYEKDEELEALKAQVQQLIDLQTAENNKKDPTLARIDDDLEAVKAKVESMNRELSQSAAATSTEEVMFGAMPELPGPSSPSTNPYPRTTSPSTVPKSFDRTAELSADALFGPPPSYNGGNGSALKPQRQEVVDPKTGLTATEMFGAIPGALAADELELNEAILNAVPSKRLTPHEQKIKNAPALGSVLSYSDGLVTINAGSENMLREGSILQIRRGAQVLGKIQIEKVFPDQSVASFVNTAGLIPGAGDQVITSF